MTDDTPPTDAELAQETLESIEDVLMAIMSANLRTVALLEKLVGMVTIESRNESRTAH